MTLETERQNEELVSLEEIAETLRQQRDRIDRLEQELATLPWLVAPWPRGKPN